MRTFQTSFELLFLEDDGNCRVLTGSVALNSTAEFHAGPINGERRLIAFGRHTSEQRWVDVRDSEPLTTKNVADALAHALFGRPLPVRAWNRLFDKVGNLGATIDAMFALNLPGQGGQR